MYYYIYVKKYGLEQPDIAGFDNMYKYGSNWRISKEREYGIKKEACFTGLSAHERTAKQASSKPLYLYPFTASISILTHRSIPSTPAFI